MRCTVYGQKVDGNFEARSAKFEYDHIFNLDPFKCIRHNSMIIRRNIINLSLFRLNLLRNNILCVRIFRFPAIRNITLTLRALNGEQAHLMLGRCNPKVHILLLTPSHYVNEMQIVSWSKEIRIKVLATLWRKRSFLTL